MRWIEKRNRWLLAGNRPWKTVAKKRKGGRSHREEDSIRPEGRFRGKRRLANKRKIAALLARGKTKQPRNRTDLVGFRRGLSETACSRQCSIGKGIALSCDRFFIFFSFLLFLFSFSFLFFCLQRYTQWLKLVVDELHFRYILQRFRERERERKVYYEFEFRTAAYHTYIFCKKQANNFYLDWSIEAKDVGLSCTRNRHANQANRMNFVYVYLHTGWHKLGCTKRTYAVTFQNATTISFSSTATCRSNKLFAARSTRIRDLLRSLDRHQFVERCPFQR